MPLKRASRGRKEVKDHLVLFNVQTVVKLYQKIKQKR